MNRFARTCHLALLAGLLSLSTSCRPGAASESWQGYVEADYVRLASPLGGTLQECSVTRGARVRAGDILVRLESDAERAAVDEATRRRDQAAARLENLRKGRRQTELDAAEARVNQVRAELDLADLELKRRERLLGEGVITPSERDQARARRDALQAGLEAASAELATSRLGARDDEIRAAEAELAAAEAGLARSRWSLDRKTLAAPVDAVVHDTLFQPGEFVPAAQPVLSLLPATNLHVRFFVPEPQLSTIPVGAGVLIRIDGQSKAIQATVRYRATQPEFTPPVIFSREARARLVYRLEATLSPDQAASLSPGQPVDVRPATGPAGPGA